jgi:O-antigen/teichoic acid export membrane protein
MIANIALILVGLIRSTYLTRNLPVDTFGIYSWSGSLATLTSVLASFGLGGAFLHRAPETEDEEQTAAVHFTLQLILSTIWALLLLGYAFIFKAGEARLTLIVLTISMLGSQIAHTPRLILARRIIHRRLALFQIINVILSSLAAVGLAWTGLGIWALLVTDLVTFALNIGMFYIWHPVWQPRVVWQPNVIRYFLSFGIRNLTAEALLRALDRVDDLWVGTYLGNVANGYYSRAFTFATYPRKILAQPVNLVTGGTYAELKNDPLRLSQAFYRVNGLLIRSGFLIAGGFALVAPEFIRIVLTDKWLPILDAFRLMLIYTLFDPIKLTIAALFVAVGKPEKIAKARFVQFLTMILGLFILGPKFGISGVALTVDLMLIIGIGLLLWQAQEYVNFSLIKLLGAPSIALITGLGLARLAITIPGVLGSDWRSGFVKGIVFVTVYGSSLSLLERKNMTMLWEYLKSNAGQLYRSPKKT